MKPDFPTPAPVSPAQLRAAPRRLEGREKVRGQIAYAGDLSHPEMSGPLDVAVAVTSTQASGQVLGIDVAAALAMPGVRLVVTHENAPRLHPVASFIGSELTELLPLQEAQLYYYGQCLALVVADTLEHARAAATKVVVRYSAPNPAAIFTLAQGLGRAEDAQTVGVGGVGQVTHGDPEPAYAAAPHRVDCTFTTSPHHHNTMEPGAAIAAWTADGGLTVQLPTQFSYGDATILGQAFGIGLDEQMPRIVVPSPVGGEFDNRVRVISTMVGGSFGSKGANVQLLLAPMAAKLNGRPVKLVLTREQTFSLMPFRAESWQRIRLGADASGHLQAVLHHAVAAKALIGQCIEPMGELTAKLYAASHIGVRHQRVLLHTNVPGWMRSPGACVGNFAVESAMDILAHQLGLDPLEMRLRNHADVEPDTGHEWSSKSLIACYQAAAVRIGWAARDPRVGAMRENGRLVGYGMATSMYPTPQLPATARVTLHPDGRAVVQTASHEIGQGLITALTQIAAEALGLELTAVHLEWGDTRLPYGSFTGGSMSTLTTGAAIMEAAGQAQQALFRRVVADAASPLHGWAVRDLQVVEGRVMGPGGVSETVAAALARHPDDLISEEADTGRTLKQSPYGRAAFGAQFVKVSVDPDTMDLRVERLIGAFAAGRIINPLTVRSQLLGGMVWGIGQALMEASSPDLRTGRWMNANLAEALVPTHADILDLEAIIIEEDDTRGHPLGVKGLGELGGTGTAAAIANAIFHATGQRLTALPMRLDHLLPLVAERLRRVVS